MVWRYISASFTLSGFTLRFFTFCKWRLPPVGPLRKCENKAPVAERSDASDHYILVELFTSEGCSRPPPPADAFTPETGCCTAPPRSYDAQLIVLSEHVDYWDHDGWKDPNSSPALTERPSAYINAIGLKTPYTPQIIVDGTAEMRIGDRDQVIKVFQAAAAVAQDSRFTSAT